MGKKATKATKKFASSGQLRKTIQTRHKHQEMRKRIQSRRGYKNKDGGANIDEGDDEIRESRPLRNEPRSSKNLTVDDILNGKFMDAEGIDEDDHNSASGEGVDEDSEGEGEDDGSFASVDDLDDEGNTHLLELSKLAEKDPEFYQYLQENDRELLEFDPNPSVGSDTSDEEVDQDGDANSQLPTLTSSTLKQWQTALLQQRSLRALRKLLIAFRSAVHMNDDKQVLTWSIDNSSVFKKLVTTALRYTPVVLEHHIPYRTHPNGNFKPPTQTNKFRTLQKLILSFFQNIVHILSQLTDEDMIELAVKESAKLIPYVVTSRKTIKQYLKKCLELWSSAQDSIRIAAILTIRRLAAANDSSIMDNILQGVYLTLLRSSKATTAYSLPSINMMKNSGSEIFCIGHTIAYQHAFGYIRQLAIHLRNSMKVKTKEAYRQVYNWQFAHCVDFWAIVLSRASDMDPNAKQESELRGLIYPLVQVSLGAIKLVSSSRYYPFHLHIIRSLLRLSHHTETYIPISPYILPILTTALSNRAKSSTVKPLDLEVHIRAPQQHLKTRVYAEGLVEEASYVLAEWLASKVVHGSIAFPELVIPIVVSLRKTMKYVKSGHTSASLKIVGVVKALLERIEESAFWAAQKRKSVTFAPGHTDGVAEWENDLKARLNESPLEKYIKVQKKVREKRRRLVEKAHKEEVETVED